MRKLLFFLLLAGIFAFSGVGVSAQFVQCDRNRFSPIQCGYYEEGYRDGASDAQANRANDYRRYRDKIDGRRYETNYQDGYDAGYSSIRPTTRWDSAQRSAYDTGYRLGDNDRRRNISRLPARYEGQYERSYEIYYQQGYFDGFDNKAKQYDTPLGGNYPTNPNYPTYPTNPSQTGTPTGTVTWSGRVDNRVNIVIQGANIRTDDITNSGFQQGYVNINGVLPRRTSVVAVAKNQGRGTAQVVQQPSRANDYVAIIQISDPKSGSDNYRLDISWQASSVEEPYQSGRVNWRGRVDQTANIVISGSDVQTQTVSGPVTGANFNISGYLARRNGTVTARKRNGRGTVTILQQPNADNDFVAIIQVFDPDRSDDAYDVEITW